MLKRLAIFYHIWTPASGSVWKLLIDEQVKRVLRSGFKKYGDLNCVISGQAKEEIAKFVKSYNIFDDIIVSDEQEEYEGVTLRELHKRCVAKDYDAVGYFHTKGISFYSKDAPNVQIRAVNTWRHIMEYVILDHWRECVRNLKDHDVIGANYRTEPWPHISGNFWWARADYIRKLIVPKIQNFSYENPLNLPEAHRNRLYFEKWIGMNTPRILSPITQPFTYIVNGELKRKYFDLHTQDIYHLLELNDDIWRL